MRPPLPCLFWEQARAPVCRRLPTLRQHGHHLLAHALGVVLPGQTACPLHLNPACACSADASGLTLEQQQQMLEEARQRAEAAATTGACDLLLARAERGASRAGLVRSHSRLPAAVHCHVVLRLPSLLPPVMPCCGLPQLMSLVVAPPLCRAAAAAKVKALTEKVHPPTVR